MAQKNMQSGDSYSDFTRRLKLLASRNPRLITMTLSNIFTMRLIGNKTHGDLAEIAISEFINQYMYDFTSTHVGKDLYRAKTQEEDITITNSVSGINFPLSLKAYGDGPLQLSTDKSFRMFPRLLAEESDEINDLDTIRAIFDDPAFSDFRKINVMSLIYDEKKQVCNIMVFDYQRAILETTLISKMPTDRGRKHPVFRFLNAGGEYICEIRYGDAAANALQRGLWTHTKKCARLF